MSLRGKCTVSDVAMERGCLVFAVISAIASGLSLLASVVKIVLNMSEVYKLMEDFDSIDIKLSDKVEFFNLVAFIPSFFYVILAIISSIIFGFSVIVCNGIWKRKADQVKAYFIFGVTLTVILVTAAVTSFTTGVTPLPGIFTILACVIYSVYLVFVCLIYFRFVDETTYRDHIPLVEA